VRVARTLELEPLVRLLEHQLVVGTGVPSSCRHTWWAGRLVVHGVEEVRRVGAPRAAVVAARTRRQVLAGVEVAEAQLVDLVAGAVHRVGQQVLVRADQRQAELEVAGLVDEQRWCRGAALYQRVTVREAAAADPVARRASLSRSRNSCAYSLPAGSSV
jgi:hypothetical protein